MERTFDYVVERAKEAEQVVIVAASRCGREVLVRLKQRQNVNIVAFFDNDDKKEGATIHGIKVVKPYCLKNDNVLYIISVDTEKWRDELKRQLLAMGVKEEQITRCYCEKDDEYYANLDEKYLKDEISLQYYAQFERELNWDNPTHYNEIINWEKVNVRDERRTWYADKAKVREYVKSKIGEQYVAKRYGEWDNVEDIDFCLLPDSFVLKLNHGSGMNIVIKDKSQMDEDAVREQLNVWKNMKYVYFHGSFEMHYKDIVPRIVCEEYLEGLAESVYDYNIYCFQGEPEYIWCIKGSHKSDCKATFYDKNWTMQDFYYGYPKDEELAPRPEGLEEMLRLSRILAEDFSHVRVDWYNMPDGRVIFGELTFATWAGMQKFVPAKYDEIFGKLAIGNRKEKYEWKMC